MYDVDETKTKATLAAEDGYEVLETEEELIIRYQDSLQNVRQLTLGKCPDFEVSLLINNKSVKIKESMTKSLAYNQSNQIFIGALRKFMNFQLCNGFSVSSSGQDANEMVLVNKNSGKVAGSFEHSGSQIVYHSVACSVLVNPQNVSGMCTECLYLKKNKS